MRFTIISLFILSLLTLTFNSCDIVNEEPKEYNIFLNAEPEDVVPDFKIQPSPNDTTNSFNGGEINGLTALRYDEGELVTVTFDNSTSIIVAGSRRQYELKRIEGELIESNSNSVEFVVNQNFSLTAIYGPGK